MRRKKLALAIITTMTFSGCTTNIDALLAQSLAAGGTTVVDLIITNLVNQLADSLVPSGVM